RPRRLAPGSRLRTRRLDRRSARPLLAPVSACPASATGLRRNGALPVGGVALVPPQHRHRRAEPGNAAEQAAIPFYRRASCEGDRYDACGRPIAAKPLVARRAAGSPASAPLDAAYPGPLVE